jgi:hypothetical protein
MIRTAEAQRLPSWPAVRIVREAVATHNDRHDDAWQLHADTSPWPEIHACVLRFLRHRLSGYDAELDNLGRYDEEHRDQLAAEIARTAARQYPWLANDPRPFEPAESTGHRLVLDNGSRKLSELHSRRDQIQSAIRDLRRDRDKHREKLAALAEELTKVEDRIEYVFAYFERTPLRTGYGAVLRFSRRPNDLRYFFGGQTLHKNHLIAERLTCPQCSWPVMRSKRAVPCGQMRKAFAFSCGCLTLLADPPPRGYVIPAFTTQMWELAVAGETVNIS